MLVVYTAHLVGWVYRRIPRQQRKREITWSTLSRSLLCWYYQDRLCNKLVKASQHVGMDVQELNSITRSRSVSGRSPGRQWHHKINGTRKGGFQLHPGQMSGTCLEECSKGLGCYSLFLWGRHKKATSSKTTSHSPFLTGLRILSFLRCPPGDTLLPPYPGVFCRCPAFPCSCPANLWFPPPGLNWQFHPMPLTWLAAAPCFNHQGGDGKGRFRKLSEDFVLP